MPHYHLLSTHRNADGSFDTPNLDESLAAASPEAAVSQARVFPLRSFDGDSDVAWLVDEAGRLLWTQDLARLDAA